MKAVEITLKSTIVAQFTPGVVKAVMDKDGTVYLPSMVVPVSVASEKGGDCSCEKEETKKAETVKETKKEVPAVKTKDVQTYTDDELLEMKSKDLEVILRESYGIEPDDYEGKNTNKKLRQLILKAQNGGEEKEEKGETTETTETATEEDSLEEALVKTLADFEDGVSKKKTAAAINALLPEKELDDIIDVLEEFENAEEADKGSTVKTLLGKKKAPVKKAKDAEELVDAADLKKGDKVSVYWEDENEDWFNGVVASITRKGKVMIDYEDGTSEEIDPEIHTKIKVLG